MLLLTLVGSLLLLFLGANFLVSGSSSIARRLGLPPLAIGLTIVAYGTSAPELVVSMQAALAGNSGISVGNVVGSNSFNIGVILGLTALLCPIGVERRIVKIDAPVMLGISALAALLLWNGHLGRIEAGVFLLLCVAYTVANLRNTNEGVEKVEATREASRKTVKDVGYFSLGLGMSVVGSKLLVSSASELARGWGVTEAVIGLTIVSAGTSMPELVTSVSAALRREPDIAIGNVIGSNVFNIVGILGISAMVQPIAIPQIGVVDLGVMVLFAAALLPVIWSGFRVRRLEGVFLLSAYGLYLWYLWP